MLLLDRVVHDSFSSRAAQTDLRRFGQFIIGPRVCDEYPNWRKYRVASKLHLSAHPELSVTQAIDGARSLTLIGYMLDPRSANATDGDILSRLLPSCTSIEQLIADTAELGGRWTVVAICDDGNYVFTDALGLRQVFHTRRRHEGGVWVMSQPGLALETLKLPFEKQALDFIESPDVQARPEFRLPAAAGLLDGLRHLLPNHVLDLDTGHASRFWPRVSLPAISAYGGALRAVRLMTGLIEAAAARFDLTLALTAGIDSRLVLAASRRFKDQLTYITVRQTKMADSSHDMWVPPKLLARLGLKHEIVRAGPEMSAEFRELHQQHVLLAHDRYGPDAEALRARFNRRSVVMTGSGAEVTRCAFRKQLPNAAIGRIGAEELARVEGHKHPYAIRYYSEWLAGLGNAGNVHVLDLFEWEQGHGCWLAMTQLEFDVAWRDIFTPYNCRALLTTLLSVNEQHRRAPDYSLFRTMTEMLWPEVLLEPINPDNQVSRFRQYKERLRRVGRLYPSPA